MKDLSGVNLCVWIEILRLLKIWLTYLCCTCVLISVFNGRVFDMEAYGSVEDHLEW